TQLPVTEKKLEVVKVFSDEILLITPSRHPLAGAKSVSASDVTGYPLLLPKSGTTRSRLNQWLEPVESEVQISMELDSTEMIKRFVIAGLGLSFVAGSHCQEEIEAGNLAAMSLSPEPMIRRLGLIYRKDKALSRAALGFIQVMMEKAGSPALTTAAQGL
ncbi:MAG: LysR family transcriptional regulator substrate-binding protein, partial [Bryobacteraceae bacterium]|nr:LysR family transcriptional regulator substrate-binding protein [Bryobacteraceae bacterium]